MKKQIFNFIFIGFVYLIATIVYSYFFGLPPFHHGITIGYPAIYYQFSVSETEFQYGTIGINIFYNLFIVIGLYSLFFVLKSRKKRNI